MKTFVKCTVQTLLMMCVAYHKIADALLVASINNPCAVNRDDNSSTDRRETDAEIIDFGTYIENIRDLAMVTIDAFRAANFPTTRRRARQTHPLNGACYEDMSNDVAEFYNLLYTFGNHLKMVQTTGPISSQMSAFLSIKARIADLETSVLSTMCSVLLRCGDITINNCSKNITSYFEEAIQRYSSVSIEVNTLIQDFDSILTNIVGI